ncbi:DUF3857 domain-containing protein [Tamlana haliotis]|uniref:DUF3857 domain-containing protein n=1 Tax=Pseudotamlana haliotis TaxID=2614804 RepID=A0A6N6MBY0_9FLAO|nr:DUF3857 domain-containing protein [Tamlana haliotis]KAB1067140.1 DUF3857 domain-containing protein [Tamlana haliotis]
MNKALLVLFLLCTFLHIFAQENYNADSFNITSGDLTTNTFKKDSTANAIVIYEYGNSYVDKNDFKLRTEVKRKIKILNQEGFDHANVLIHLYKNDSGRYEKASEIIGTTRNQVGGQVETTKLKEAHIFREEYDENHTLVKFTLPNIKAGSVITYSYTITSPFMFKYHGWAFQSDIPTLYSQYDTSIPGYWDYHIKLVGGKKLAINDSELKKTCLEVGRGSADCAISTYVMKDVPAFIEEDFITTKQNYLARIEYELKTFTQADGVKQHYTKSWKDVDKELRTDKDIGKQLKKSIDLEEFLAPEIIAENDPLKKAQAIFSYVQTNYTWNEEYDIFNDVAVKDLIKNKSGNVSSINILLHNLLNEAGVKVKPVLLSTRNNGFPTMLYPVLSDYNYILVQAIINDKTYLLDATDDYLSFGQIPYRCLNHHGRLFDFKNESKWIDLKPNNQTASYYMAELSLDDNNALSGQVRTKKTGYHAYDSKKAYRNDENAYLKDLEEMHLNSEVSDLETDLEDHSSPEFKESYHIKHELESIAGNIYLSPILMQFFSENPFKLQERTYPIDFGYKDTYFYSANINIGSGYAVKSMPEDMAFQLPNNTGTFVFTSKQVNNAINVMLKITFNKSIYEPEYYEYLKEFMSKILEVQNNSTILITKSS